jgi:hypothetical protein
MSERRLQRDTGRQWLVATRAWFGVLVASFLLAVPTIRTNELNEIAGAKERVEDATLVTRSDHRRNSQNVRRETAVFSSAIQARLGRERQVEPAHADGHRLANGLLAPMTC